jgi:hypothetical protein
MGVFKKLGDGIADLSELQVQTLTGELSTAIQSDNAKRVLDWQKLIKAAKTKTQGSVRLVAATNLKIDGDTDLFIAESAPDRLLRAHSDAVEAAGEVRASLIAMFKDLLDVG